MGQVTLNGARIAYDDAGTGTPVFVFIHGWACDRSCWRAQIDGFSADHRCVAIDLRGRGESEAGPPYRVGQALEDVAALIRELGLAPVILVGHSLGGIIALAVNGRYPELVLGTVVIDSPITAETGAGSPRSVSMIREAGSMRAVEGFIRTFNYDPPHPAAAAYIEEVMLTCPADVGAGMLEDLHLVGQDMPRLIREADRKPFMAIWAEKPLGDPVWLRDHTMFLRQEPVAGCGHFVHMEQPAVVNALLRAFLDDVARDPRVSIQWTRDWDGRSPGAKVDSMSDSTSRPRRRPSGSTRQTVGGRGGGRTFPAVFIAGVIAVVLAFVVLLVVAADAFSDGGTPVTPVDTPTQADATTAAATSTTASAGGQTATAAPATATPTPGADGTTLVACGDILAPVDKQHRLTRDCVPANLRQLPARYASGYQSLTEQALGALTEMFEAAEKEGFAMSANSSYRSYDTQASIYSSAVAAFGQAYADRSSARAGHSEHQLGTTADIGARGLYLEDFVGSPEAAWVAANSHRFGFIVSYPDGKEAITGYMPEPWHVRFVGKDVAAQVKSSGLTLHEFLLK